MGVEYMAGRGKIRSQAIDALMARLEVNDGWMDRGAGLAFAKIFPAILQINPSFIIAIKDFFSTFIVSIQVPRRSFHKSII